MDTKHANESKDVEIADEHDEYRAHGVNRVDLDAEFGGHENRMKIQKKLLRKVDARMFVLVVIYILNYIDRNNASAAKLKGFERDLNLTGQQFDTLLSILYVGYILMQIPSNMLLNRIGKPSLHIPICIIIWGMISTLTGVTEGFVGALLTRFFLGFVEAAFFPGALFLLSKWYTREELGLRTTILACGNLISNAFGSLIASGILSNMDGVLGHAAWRWLFYIEGAITMLVGIVAIFILPDFPSTSRRFLTEDEQRLAVLRMENDVGETREEDGVSQMAGLRLAFTDWRVYFLSLALTSMVVGLSFNAFFPTLTATLGYNSTNTLLLCAPPWVFSTIIAFIVNRHADKVRERCFHIVVPLCFGIVGFIIAMSTMKTAPRYVALFLMAQSYAGFIGFLAWISNSLPTPPAKRAVALAYINAFSQLGNVAGSYVWPKDWGFSYRNSYSICIATFALTIVMCLVFRQVLKKQNEEIERREVEEGKKPGFRYML
ncbi:MFS general substrate transporter [Peniophora sp. CONT]|nr:MFS general substrate transporter [Peniophora sp. CONT]